MGMNFASKSHCRIDRRTEGCFLTDLSVNGTYIKHTPSQEFTRLIRSDPVKIHEFDVIGIPKTPCEPSTRQKELFCFELRLRSSTQIEADETCAAFPGEVYPCRQERSPSVLAAQAAAHPSAEIESSLSRKRPRDTHASTESAKHPRTSTSAVVEAAAAEQVASAFEQRAESAAKRTERLRGELERLHRSEQQLCSKLEEAK
jgi:predicted component of type VI protein secretion system